MEGEGGHLAEFEVVNADDWAAGNARPRIILERDLIDCAAGLRGQTRELRCELGRNL
jgi:hypothetical protein